MIEYIQLKIVTREAKIFDAKVESITCVNEKGKFDILPYHIQFISLLDQNINFVDEYGQHRSIVLTNGILRVIRNTVSIYGEVRNI